MGAQMILIVGATGRLGRVVTGQLLGKGHQVRAGCRRHANDGNSSSRGAEWAVIDLRDPTSFPAALAGVSQVVAAVQGLTGRRADTILKVDLEGHQRLIDAAETAGVQNFVYVSAQGASPSHPSAFLRAKATIESYLARSTLQHVVLRPSAFMELYAHELIGSSILAGKRVFLLGHGESSRNLVSIEDVAAAVVVAVEGQLSSSRIEITGPSNVTEREIAATYARLSGRSAKVSSVPSVLLSAIANSVGPFHAGVRNLLIFGGQNHQHGSMVSDASHMTGIIRREPKTLEAFVREQIDKIKKDGSTVK